MESTKNQAEGGCVVTFGVVSFVCIAFYYGMQGEEPRLYSSLEIERLFYKQNPLQK